MTNIPARTRIVVIGAGQAGLSAAYHLSRLGADFIVLDGNERAGGAWQHRWPSLTLDTVNRIHDLPGWSFAEAVPGLATKAQARTTVPQYFAAYERHFKIRVLRPVRVHSVRPHGAQFLVETNQGATVADGIINATGTWETPHIPRVPGTEQFLGTHIHTKDYHRAEDFVGKHVVVVGAGISAIQLLDEISRVTTTTWVTRREPDFREGPFDENAGRRAVALVEKRVRQGLEPRSVVSVTGLPVTAQIRAMQARGVLNRLPMFTRIEEHGVRFADGSFIAADVIFWNTGFRGSLDHFSALDLRSPQGGIVMGGRLATKVVANPRIHLVGYGPSASTIGANRAGGAAARELLAELASQEAHRAG